MITSRLPRAFADRINWPLTGKIFSIALLICVAIVLASFARRVDWHEVMSDLRTYTPAELSLSALLTAASFVLYSCYDLFGRHYTRHTVSTPRVMSIAAISYAFNLTLGSIVGAAGIRIRLYRQAGVTIQQVARIIAISVSMNWLGYALVAGVLFSAGSIHLPDSWGVAAASLPMIGRMLLLALSVYIATCLFWGDRSYTSSGGTFTVPRAPAALLQVAVAGGNWVLMGWILFLLLQQRVEFSLALATVLSAGIAGVMSRVPGGLGILEAVALALLSERLPQSQILAAVLAYRAIYYLIPLLLAGLVFAALSTLHREHSCSD